MAMTLTGVLWEPIDISKSDLLDRISASIDAFVRWSGHTVEQVVLENELESGDIEALEPSSVNLSDALDLFRPLDLYVLVEDGIEIDVAATIELDIDQDVPQFMIGGQPDQLQARELLLELVQIWDATIGFHTDEPLMEITADFPIPVGQYTWLAPGYDAVLTHSQVLLSDEVADGMLFSFRHELATPEILRDATELVRELESDD